MAKARSIYMCTQCGAQHPRWLGRCPSCEAWSSLVEEVASDSGVRKGAKAVDSSNAPTALSKIGSDASERMATGISELDRVLGGGLVSGGVVLLGGEPGVGKSTLSLQFAGHVQRSAGSVLYVTGEESPEQLRLRAERLAGISPDVLVLAETSVEAVMAHWDATSPKVVLIDSIQTMRTDLIDSAPGSVAQVRESAALLSSKAKALGTVLVLVGHVTKEGTLAGPRVLEHLVDVVLTFEGDRDHAFRILRASKNRFGSTQEVGVFSMGAKGLEEVANPSELFLAERKTTVPGSCIVPLLEGSRPMMIEIQALVAPNGAGPGRRTCLGVDGGRVALLLAVLERRTGASFMSRDVYVNVTGGVRVSETAADLAASMALASSLLDRALPPDVAICGEVGLGGEVRSVGRLDVRLREAGRLGFTRVLVPAGAKAPRCKGVEAIPIANVKDAVRWLRQVSVPEPPGGSEEI